MKTGAQLYTVRAYTQSETDFALTISKIAKIGYKTVQISAIGNIRPERVREICDREGVEIVLTHSDVNRILHDTKALIREHDILDEKRSRRLAGAQVRQSYLIFYKATARNNKIVL